MNDKMIGLKDLPVIRELVEETIAEKTDDIEAEIEDIKKNGDKVNIFVLHDWDDEVIGIVATPLGYDPRPYVNEYIKTNLIHPDLREQTAEERASIERQHSYRGEYPYTAPDPDDPLKTGGENTVTDGGDYPLTNHLDYVFAGKDYNEEYPYVSGWTEVTPDNMSETFTALTPYLQDAFGDAAPEGETQPRLIRFDFTKFSGGCKTPMITHLKAVYLRGEKLNSGETKYTVSSVETRMLTQRNVAHVRIGITPTYKRINYRGYGVQVANKPTFKCIETFDGGVETYLRHDVISHDVIASEIDIDTKELGSLEYRLCAMVTPYYQQIGFYSASWSSDEQTIDIQAVLSDFKWKEFQKEIYDITAGVSTIFAYAYSDMNEFGFRYLDGVEFSKAAQLNLSKMYMKKFIAAGIEAGQTDPYSYTYYQYQYAIMTKGTGYGTPDEAVYLTPEAAESYCKANYDWCSTESDTEGGEQEEE